MEHVFLIPYVSLIWLLYFFLCHWIADFVLQTHEQATNKSSSMRYLTAHTSTYSLAMSGAFLGLIFGEFSLWAVLGKIFVFYWVTFIAHTITDFYTSRAVKHYFDKENYHNGFVVIGLDQILHYMQLLITIKLIAEV